MQVSETSEACHIGYSGIPTACFVFGMILTSFMHPSRGSLLRLGHSVVDVFNNGDDAKLAKH